MGPRLFRLFMRFFPAYRGTGGRVTYISPDWREWRIRLPLSWRTRNYVGTIYGGSLYASVDPIYMLAFIKILGPDYIVWDKAATVRFRRPGRSTLFATFKIPDDEVETVQRLCREHPKVDRTYRVELVDRDGVVHCEVEKVLHFRLKSKEPEKTARGKAVPRRRSA